MVIHIALVSSYFTLECLVMTLCISRTAVYFEIVWWYLVSKWNWLNRCRLCLEYRERCEQTRIMVYSICIPISKHRERSLIKLGMPFLLKGNFIHFQNIYKTQPHIFPIVRYVFFFFFFFFFLQDAGIEKPDYEGSVQTRLCGSLRLKYHNQSEQLLAVSILNFDWIGWIL